MKNLNVSFSFEMNSSKRAIESVFSSDVPAYE